MIRNSVTVYSTYISIHLVFTAYTVVSQGPSDAAASGCQTTTEPPVTLTSAFSVAVASTPPPNYAIEAEKSFIEALGDVSCAPRSFANQTSLAPNATTSAPTQNSSPTSSSTISRPTLTPSSMPPATPTSPGIIAAIAVPAAIATIALGIMGALWWRRRRKRRNDGRILAAVSERSEKDGNARSELENEPRPPELDASHLRELEAEVGQEMGSRGAT